MRCGKILAASRRIGIIIFNGKPFASIVFFYGENPLRKMFRLVIRMNDTDDFCFDDTV